MPELIAARKERQRAPTHPVNQIVDGSEIQTHLLTSRDTTSSTVTVPIGRLSSSITVSIRRLYLSNSSKTSFSLASGVMLTNGSVLSSDIDCSGEASNIRATGTVPKNSALSSTSTIVSSCSRLKSCFRSHSSTSSRDDAALTYANSVFIIPPAVSGP